MKTRRLGFTIVELLVVIVVIGILAGVAIVGYGAWRNDVVEKQLKSDLTGAASAMENGRNFGNQYPDSLPASFKASDGTTLTVRSGGGTYCVQAVADNYPDKVFNVKNGKQPAEGNCDNYYVASINVGTYASCGIQYGKAYCWGGDSASSFPVLGNGTMGSSLVPVPVDTTVMKGSVSKVASGNGTICAISEGKVYCWGNSSGGNLGNGTISPHAPSPVAVNTSIMNGYVTDISMTSMSTCAIAGGKAYCWGANEQGQIGANLTGPRSEIPVAVNTSVMSGTVSKISVGTTQVCAISDGKLYCWGSGHSTGTGGTGINRTPVAISIPGKVTDVSASTNYTCAVADGKAYCWGQGSHSATANGFLGIGSTGQVSIPTPVDTTNMPGTVTTITAKGSTTCALADDKAYCWGSNGTGQLGDGTKTNSNIPVAVDTSVMSGKVTTISEKGDSHACAIADDKLYCWGYSNGGQVGYGSTADATKPVAVDTSLMKGKVTSVSAGALHTCAIADDRMFCWGNNAKGQLGNGTTTSSSVPSILVPGV